MATALLEAISRRGWCTASCSNTRLVSTVSKSRTRFVDSDSQKHQADVELDSDLEFIKPINPKAKWELPEAKFVPPGARWKTLPEREIANIMHQKQRPGLEKWLKAKLAVKAKIGGAEWDPRKKLSPEARNALRELKKEYPQLKSSEIAEYFGISTESVRRILKSRWKPLTQSEQEKVALRWERRQERILDTWADIGRIPARRKDELSEESFESPTKDSKNAPESKR